ncbi:MAG: hypothetical protein AAF390_00070 [Pseudomonadota bacterium]
MHARPKMSPAVPTPAPGKGDARDQARTLLSLLESGAKTTDGAIPPERLRDLARDVIARVEAQGGRPPPAAPVARAPETPLMPSTPRPTLFRNADPFGVAKVARPAPTPAPVEEADELPSPISSRVAQPQGQGDADGSGHRVPWLRDRAAVRKLMEKAFRPEDAAAEHPAILALDLAGRPPREQAERLRQVPSGRVRATHRHLVALERSKP